MKAPDVAILVTPDCPHAGEAETLVREVVGRLSPDAVVRRVVVADRAEAEALAFPGSPTIRIDDEDLEGEAAGPVALACRTYEDGGGVPPRWLIESRLLRAGSPRHVLFLCVANSARSQMAEGIARRLAPPGVRVSSAGSEPSRVNPYAVRALAELGIDASGHRSEGTDDIAAAVERGDSPPVDTVITLCAEEVCPVWLHEVTRLHWPHPDPAAATGDEDEILASFRSVRNVLADRLAALFEPPAVDPSRTGRGTPVDRGEGRA